MTAAEREAIARLTAIVEGIDDRLGNDDRGLIHRVRKIEASVERDLGRREQRAETALSIRAKVSIGLTALIGAAGLVTNILRA